MEFMIWLIQNLFVYCIESKGKFTEKEFVKEKKWRIKKKRKKENKAF